MAKIKLDAPTRGNLITRFLLDNITATDYSKLLLKIADLYNGYNLVYGKIDDLYYFSNIVKEPVELTPGIHGLSNHLMDTPWPKVIKSKNEFSKILKEQHPSHNKFFELLKDNEVFNDETLPDTGLEKELERLVSPIFTLTEKYGTRSSSLIFVDNNDNVSFTEKSFNNKNKEWKTESFNFEIEAE